MAARPWNDYEKTFLLAEILKQRSPSVAYMSDLALQFNPAPNWEELSLPFGRSVSDCRTVFEELRRMPRPTPMAPYAGIPPQTPLSAPLQSLKRPFQLEKPFPGREIRPKPAQSEARSAASPPTSEPPKKKRGRPTKEEALARAAAAASAGSSGSALPPSTLPLNLRTSPALLPRTSPATLPAPLTPLAVASSAPPPPAAVSSAPPVETPPSTQPHSGMSIQAVLQTPDVPKTGSSSSSSSGKRRRGKSIRTETGAGESLQSGQEYETPYPRAMFALEDTPARTAVMRHREEQAGPGPAPSPQQQQQQQQQQQPALITPHGQPPSTPSGLKQDPR